MRHARMVLALVAAMLIVSPVLAGEKKKKDAKPAQPPKVEGWLEKLNLTEEQKTKALAIQKEFAPKVAEIMKKMDGVLTAEQKQARMEAMKAAKAANKKGPEAAKDVEAAMKITDDQKAKMAEIKKEMAPLDKERREKLMALLTPEQKEQLKKEKGGKKEKK